MGKSSVVSRNLVFKLAAALVLALIPFLPFMDKFILGIGIRSMIFIALGQAWNLIAGVGGQLSLGHGVFFGIGAYITVLLFNRLEITPWVGLWIGVLGAATMAFILGYATFRLRGVYFALATVAVSLGFEKLGRHYSELTGGDAGLAVRYLENAPAMMQFSNPTFFYWAGLVVVISYYLITRWILKHRFGYELQAVRDDDEAAAASGVNVFRVKMLGLAVSASMTAVVGTLHVQYYLAIDPGTAFGLFQAIQIQLPSMIGGIGTAGGPIIGGAIMVISGEVTNWMSTRIGVQSVDVLVYGLILLLVVIYAPRGILGALTTKRKRASQRAGE